MLKVNERIRLSLTEIEWSFARSSGKGGQNVNKVNSKAVLRWNPGFSISLPEDVRSRFLQRFASRLTEEGDLVLQSDRFRDQPQNISDCLDKLRAMLLEVAYPPKKRIKTKPTRSAQKKRLEYKKRHGQKKQDRRRKDW